MLTICMVIKFLAVETLAHFRSVVLDATLIKTNGTIREHGVCLGSSSAFATK